MPTANEIRTTFLEYFRRHGHEVVRVLAAGAAQRPDLAVHQRRHGAVQERVHRRRAAALQPGDHLAEMRARRRQAQRPRQCRLHRPAPHLLRDAGQFQLRRLLQAAGDRARLEPDHQGVRPDRGPAPGHGLRQRRRGVRAVAQDRRARRAAHHPHRHLATISGPWATPAPAARARRSSTTTAPTSPAARPAARTRTATAGSRSGTSSSCSTSRSTRRPASTCRKPSIDTGMGLERIAAVLQGKTDNYDIDVFEALIGASAALTGTHAEGAEPPVAQGDRRPSALQRLPDRRRRDAGQRGPRLRAAPDHAPRHAPRPAAGRARAAAVAHGAGAARPDGQGVPRAGPRRGADHRGARSSRRPASAARWSAACGCSRRRPRSCRRARRWPARSRSSSTTPTASRST